MKINWDDARSDVELKYPTFRKYVRKYKGYLCCPAEAEVKLWFEFMGFIETVEGKKWLKKGIACSLDKHRKK